MELVDHLGALPLNRKQKVGNISGGMLLMLISSSFIFRFSTDSAVLYLCSFYKVGELVRKLRLVVDHLCETHKNHCIPQGP